MDGYMLGNNGGSLQMSARRYFRHWLVAALATLMLLSLLVVRPGVSEADHSPDHKVVECDTEGLKTGKSTETGGTLITFDLHCEGKKTVLLNVTLKVGDDLLFKATDKDEFRGSAWIQKAIHLPPPPAVPGAEVCVELVDDIAEEHKCVVIDDPAIG